MSVLSAMDGSSGVKIARGGSIDLIILDILMPGTDGFETCRQLKREQETRDIPIIFLTARGDDESIARGFELGAIDYIAKPFNRYEMLVRVKTHLQLTRHKQILQEQIDIKDRVLSIISHEIRNQFSSIKSAYQLFGEDFQGCSTVDLSSHFQLMDTGLSETQELFDNLIFWSRQQQGRLSLRLTDIALYKMVDEIRSALMGSMAKKNLELVNEIPEDLIIRGDRMIIEVVIRNFISNAIKFSFRDHKIRIHEKQENGYFSILCTDTGPGISAEVQRMLFNMQYNPTTPGTEQERGTGIGLAICAELAQAMDSSIGFTTQKDKGTDFILRLPARMVVGFKGTVNHS